MTRHSIIAIAAILTTCLSGCRSDPVLPAAANTSFDPIAFFAGRTHGEGELKKMFSAPVHVSVDSIGRRVPGGLILDQTLRQAGKPETVRRWVIQRTTENEYTGQLTEAVGPVSAKVSGPRAEIEYRMKHGLKVEQQLAEQPDHKTVLHRLTVQKLGVTVATLNETITR